MKKPFFFLLTSLLLSTVTFAQKSTTDSTTKKPHLTFLLEIDTFYYTKGLAKEKIKIQTVDSISIAKIIDVAITENKVLKKDLNVNLEGDYLMDHPQFDILLSTILSKTVSGVRVKTNLLE